MVKQSNKSRGGWVLDQWKNCLIWYLQYLFFIRVWLDKSSKGTAIAVSDASMVPMNIWKEAHLRTSLPALEGYSFIQIWGYQLWYPLDTLHMMLIMLWIEILCIFLLLHNVWCVMVWWTSTHKLLFLSGLITSWNLQIKLHIFFLWLNISWCSPSHGALSLSLFHACRCMSRVLASVLLESDMTEDNKSKYRYQCYCLFTSIMK